MKSKLFVSTLISLANLATLAVAHASPTGLEGRQLVCVTDTHVRGSQHVTYSFFSAPDGSNTAQVKEGGFNNGTSFRRYSLKPNGVLTIEGPTVYDVSNPSHIERKFQACVNSPYAGPSCEAAVENCVPN